MAILDPSIEAIKRQKVQPTDGEWALLNFLIETLDDTYEVFFQPFLDGDNPDFAIMRRGSGLLIIEVKDWQLPAYHIDDSEEWTLKKDGTVIKSPLKQVEKYKDNLFKLHSDVLFSRSIKDKKNWATVNCAVYFHNATNNELSEFLLKDFEDVKHQKYRKAIERITLLGNDSLSKTQFDQVLTKIWMNKTSYYFDQTLYDSFKRYLKSPIHESTEGKDIVYTKEQQELIRSEVRPRRKIKGVAGSGKTLVLAKRAVNAHKRTGARILILTYNLALRNYIHDRISDVREQFVWSSFYITNYHQFFKTQANNYNLEIRKTSSWQDTNFFNQVKNAIQKFDVVLIDEIQDYMQPWLDIITKYFIHSETEFIVFGDEKQNIYNRELDENNDLVVNAIPGQWNKSLNTAMRFSSNIGNIAIKFQKELFGKKYSLDELNVLSEIDFDQRIIEYHLFETPNSDKLFQAVYEVIERNKIHSSDCAILSAKVEILRELDYTIRNVKGERTITTFESKEIFPDLMVSQKRLDDYRRNKKNHFWMKSGTIKLSTIHSFKGWEIDTLFLIIEADKEDSNNDELIYTALTRARRNLIVFNLGNERYSKFFTSEIQNKFKHI